MLLTLVIVTGLIRLASLFVIYKFIGRQRFIEPYSISIGSNMVYSYIRLEEWKTFLNIEFFFGVRMKGSPPLNNVKNNEAGYKHHYTVYLT